MISKKIVLAVTGQWKRYRTGYYYQMMKKGRYSRMLKKEVKLRLRVKTILTTMYKITEDC